MRLTRFRFSAVFACAALLASASASVAENFNPQPDPPGRHGVTAPADCQQGSGRTASTGLGSGKMYRKSGGQQPMAGSVADRKAGEAPTAACTSDKH